MKDKTQLRITLLSRTFSIFAIFSFLWLAYHIYASTLGFTTALLVIACSLSVFLLYSVKSLPKVTEKNFERIAFSLDVHAISYIFCINLCILIVGTTTKNENLKFYVLQSLIVPFVVFERKRWKIIFSQLFSILCYFTMSFIELQQSFDTSLQEASFTTKLYHLLTNCWIHEIITFLIFIILSNYIIQQHVSREQQMMVMRDELLRTIIMRDQFLAKVSHEIRTPLNGILGFSSGLAESTDLHHDASIITKCANDIKNIIDEILNYNQLHENKIMIKNKCFDVHQTMAGAVERVAALARQKSLALTMKVDDGVPKFVEGDEGKLRQILLNILSNAIKYTKTGSINLSCEPLEYNSASEIKLLFKVKDTGIGIKSEDLQKLFTPFTQLHDENIGIASTGLGLVISKHLVELMNGQIWCESEFGVGSTFFFTVILRKTTEIVKPRKEMDYNESFATQFPMSILVVEDNIINQMVITNHLKRFGYTNVKCVENGKKAIEIVQKEDFDLIFMDIYMPIMNGLESTRNIRSLKLKRQPCIYALTASSMRSDQVACEKAGMDGLISKPIEVKQLVKVLKKAFTKMGK